MTDIYVHCTLTIEAKKIAAMEQGKECHAPQIPQTIVKTTDSMKKWSPADGGEAVVINGVEGCWLTTTTLVLLLYKE